VRALPLGDPAEAGGQDLGHGVGEAGPESGFFEAALEIEQGIVVAAERAEMHAGRETEQVRGGQRGAEGETARWRRRACF
jgi:hypothetical protein